MPETAREKFFKLGRTAKVGGQALKAISPKGLTRAQLRIAHELFDDGDLFVYSSDTKIAKQIDEFIPFFWNVKGGKLVLSSDGGGPFIKGGRLSKTLLKLRKEKRRFPLDKVWFGIL